MKLKLLLLVFFIVTVTTLKAQEKSDTTLNAKESKPNKNKKNPIKDNRKKKTSLPNSQKSDNNVADASESAEKNDTFPSERINPTKEGNSQNTTHTKDKIVQECGELKMNRKKLIYVRDENGDLIPIRKYKRSKNQNNLNNQKAISVVNCRVKITKGEIEEMSLTFYLGDSLYTSDVNIGKKCKIPEMLSRNVEINLNSKKALFYLGELLQFDNYLLTCNTSEILELSYKSSSIKIK